MRIPVLFSLLLLLATSLSASVVQPIGAAPQLLIPAAGSTPGLNGTFFRSDISIVNLANHDQTVSLQWLPQPGLTRPAPVTILLHALSGTRSSDFVQEILGQTGLGAIVVTGAANTDGTGIDPTAKLFASSRIWSPEPGTTGTTSQDMVTIPTSGINTPLAAIFGVGGADNQSQYRVNVGIVNLDPVNTQTFLVSFTAANGSQSLNQVTLPPMTMEQVGAGVPFSPPEILIQNQTPAATRSNLWTAYGSTINNVTGDAWSEIAVAGTAP
jgi:hypothetical protein